MTLKPLFLFLLLFQICLFSPAQGSQDSENIQEQLHIARSQLAKKEYKEAAKYIEAILAKDPDQKDALLIKGEILLAFNHYKEALAIYEKLLAKEESKEIREKITTIQDSLQKEEKAKKINKLLELATELALQYRYRSAATILEGILCEDPTNLVVHISLANVLLSAGRYKQAFKHLEYVLSVEPANKDALLSVATALRLMRNYPESIALFAGLLCRDPNDFNTLLGLTYAYAGRNNYCRARRTACQIVPQSELQAWELHRVRTYFVDGMEFDPIYSNYHDNQDLDTTKYIGIATNWFCDGRIDCTYKRVNAEEPTVEGITIHERLDEAQLDLTGFAAESVDFGMGIGYAAISKNSRGKFVVGNIRGTLYAGEHIFSFASIYDVYSETAAALFFKIRNWINFVGHTYYFSGYTFVGERYTYVKYSDGNHSNKIDLYAQTRLWDGIFQTYVNFNISYLTFASQPLSFFFNPSIISGTHGYFDPIDALNTQLSFPTYYDQGGRIYLYFYPYLGYLTYHLLGFHYNGPYFIANGVFGYRFSYKAIGEFTGEWGAYDLSLLHYTYRILLARLRLVF